MDILELDELICLANVDLENDHLAEALVKLKLALQKGGETEVHAMLARVYARLGLLERSKQHFEQFLADNPDSLVEKFQYAMTHFDSADYDKALTVFGEILEQDSSHPPALFYTSDIFVRLKQYSLAVERLENLLLKIPKENLFYLKAQQLLAEIPSDEKTTQLTSMDADKKGDVVLN